LLIQIKIREAPAPVIDWIPPCSAVAILMAILEAGPEFVGCPRPRKPLFSLRSSVPEWHFGWRQDPLALLSATNNVSRGFISAGRCGISMAPTEFARDPRKSGLCRRTRTHHYPSLVTGAARKGAVAQE